MKITHTVRNCFEPAIDTAPEQPVEDRHQDDRQPDGVDPAAEQQPRAFAQQIGHDAENADQGEQLTQNQRRHHVDRQRSPDSGRDVSPIVCQRRLSGDDGQLAVSHHQDEGEDTRQPHGPEERHAVVRPGLGHGHNAAGANIVADEKEAGPDGG